MVTAHFYIHCTIFHACVIKLQKGNVVEQGPRGVHQEFAGERKSSVSCCYSIFVSSYASSPSLALLYTHQNFQVCIALEIIPSLPFLLVFYFSSIREMFGSCSQKRLCCHYRMRQNEEKTIKSRLVRMNYFIRSFYFSQ